LLLVESDITIYNGHFEGGTTTSPGIFGGLRVDKEDGILASRSNVVMHGGQVVGGIEIRDSDLSIFGSQLESEHDTLSGIYADGTPFSHSVFALNSRVLLNDLIPEPQSLLLSAVGTGALVFTLHRRARDSK
jgi:hypothetical protein